MINQLLEMVFHNIYQRQRQTRQLTDLQQPTARSVRLTRMAITTRADSPRASVRSKPCSRGPLLPLFTSTLKAIIAYSSPCLNL